MRALPGFVAMPAARKESSRSVVKREISAPAVDRNGPWSSANGFAGMCSGPYKRWPAKPGQREMVRSFCLVFKERSLLYGSRAHAHEDAPAHAISPEAMPQHSPEMSQRQAPFGRPSMTRRFLRVMGGLSARRVATGEGWGAFNLDVCLYLAQKQVVKLVLCPGLAAGDDLHGHGFPLPLLPSGCHDASPGTGLFYECSSKVGKTNDVIS